MSETASKIAREEKNVNSATQNVNQPASRTNYTGIPTQLKERLEQTTGLLLDDVRVHYNSGLPAKLDALAYTQGNRVEIAPGQERHLSHELGHVVQQKLGIVRANAMHSSGVALNTEDRLERQADEIGAGKKIGITASPIHGEIVQRRLLIRRTQNVVRLSDSYMAPSNIEEQKNSNTKTARHIVSDPGYVNITEASLQAIIVGYNQWLAHNPFGNARIKDDGELANKILKMIHKSDDAPHEASYYFDSLDDFYKYIFLWENDWGQDELGFKINVVNTGAGDAIVLTVPAGYIILDMGTSLNILLNYLGLRKNKRSQNAANSRGISLTDDQTCIIISHNHRDHNAGIYTNEGTNQELNQKLQKQVINGYTDYLLTGNSSAEESVKKIQKLHSLLESGFIYIYKYDPNVIKNKNQDSLVLYRHIPDSEVVLLTGDQETEVLVSALDEIAQSGQVEHLYIKIPHHGSWKNNTVEVINKYSEVSENITATISSGSRFGHPSQKAFADGNMLYPQGTQIDYSARLPFKDESVIDSCERSRMSIYYTANLSLETGKIIPASICSKSNGFVQASYSKCYFDVPQHLQNNEEEVQAVEEEEQAVEEEEQAAEEEEQAAEDEEQAAKEKEQAAEAEVQAVESMIQEMLNAKAEAEEKRIIMERKRIDHLKEYVFFAQNCLYGNVEYPINHGFCSECPVLSLFVFCTMSEEAQVFYLTQLMQTEDKFIEYFRCIPTKWMVRRDSEAWHDFLEENIGSIYTEQNFYNICMKTCADQWIVDFFTFFSEKDEVLEILDMFISAMIDAEDRKNILKSILAISFQRDYLDSIVDNLSSDVLVKLLFAEINLTDWKEVKKRILDATIEDETRSDFLIDCLDSNRLSDEEFYAVVNCLTAREDIMQEIGLPYFYRLMRMYPNARNDIRKYINDFDLLESEEFFLPYELEKRLPENYSVTTSSDVDVILKELGIDFVKFIYCMPPESLIKDVENKIFFLYAYNLLKKDKKYIVALIETWCIYRKEYDFLMGYFRSFESKAEFPSLLENLLYEHCLSSAAVNMVYDFFIALGTGAEEILEKHPMLFLNIFEHKEDRFLCSWTDDIEKKAKLYNIIAKNNPQKILHVLKRHYSLDKGGALEIISHMEPIGWSNILGRVDLSYVLEFLLEMGRENLEVINQLLVFQDPQ